MERAFIFQKKDVMTHLPADLQKLKILFTSFLVCMVLIIARLFYLQVYEQDRLRELGELNFLRFETLYSPRGNLLDVNGDLLATNRPVFDLYWMGSGNKMFSEEQHTVFTSICRFLSLQDKEDLLKKIKRAERYGVRLLINADISFDILCRISEHCIQVGNLVVVQRFRRVYPHQHLASHVLGFLGNYGPEQFVGLSGLEKIFQDELEGEPGYVVHVTNARGKELRQKEYKEARGGRDLSLTLDLEMQRIAEKLFKEGQSGAFIIMDPEDGAVKCLVSYPNFDPNLFLSPISHQDWQAQLTHKSPFLNRVINALYPPASIFKLVTFTAGLEERVISPTSKFSCSGYIEYGGRKYYCQRRSGHGTLSGQQAIARSCNIHCYEIGKRINIDQLAHYAYAYGLGISTHFILPESKGLVPTTGWKAAVKGESWWQGETLSSCIGQSYLLVTPLQIARMIGSLCTGYLVTPRLVVGNSVDKTRLGIRDTTRYFLRHAMVEAVQSGTARKLRGLKPFTIGAKTGTAQTTSRESGKGKESLEHGWFASFFHYKDEKPLVMVALVEEAGTARPALAMAEQFLISYARYREKKGS